MGMGGWAWRLLILTRLFLNENVLELLEFWWLLVGFGMHWDGGYWRWRCIPPSSSCWLHNPFWPWRLWWLLVGFGTLEVHPSFLLPVLAPQPFLPLEALVAAGWVWHALAWWVLEVEVRPSFLLLLLATTLSGPAHFAGTTPLAGHLIGYANWCCMGMGTWCCMGMGTTMPTGRDVKLS